jgi:hypothetical protein
MSQRLVFFRLFSIACSTSVADSCVAEKLCGELGTLMPRVVYVRSKPMAAKQTDPGDIIAAIAEERQREKAAVEAFVASAQQGDVRQFYESFELMNHAVTWKPAFRALVRSGDVHDSIKRAFVEAWLNYGAHIRQEVADDLTLVRALRLLLPSYHGRGMTLFRGESWRNRCHRTYGCSWSANQSTARAHALGFWRSSPGGSVLLTARVPQNAIVFAPALGDDQYAEQEYIVDRLLLRDVRVVERFSQAGPSTCHCGTRTLSKLSRSVLD